MSSFRSCRLLERRATRSVHHLKLLRLWQDAPLALRQLTRRQYTGLRLRNHSICLEPHVEELVTVCFVGVVLMHVALNEQLHCGGQHMTFKRSCGHQSLCKGLREPIADSRRNIGTLIIRIGFRGILYYNVAARLIDPRPPGPKLLA